MGVFNRVKDAAAISVFVRAFIVVGVILLMRKRGFTHCLKKTVWTFCGGFKRKRTLSITIPNFPEFLSFK